MSLLIGILGGDRSMREMLIAALVNLVPAECDIIVAALGHTAVCKTPVEDLLLPGFAPEGEPFALRISHFSRHLPLGPRLTACLHAWSIRRVRATYDPDLIVTDGPLLPMIGQSPRKDLVAQMPLIMPDCDSAQRRSASLNLRTTATPQEHGRQYVRVIVTTHRSDAQMLIEAVDFIRSLPPHPASGDSRISMCLPGLIPSRHDLVAQHCYRG